MYAADDTTDDVEGCMSGAQGGVQERRQATDTMD